LLKSDYKLILGENLEFRFAYQMVLWIGVPLLILFSYYLLKIKRGIVYNYPLTKMLSTAGFGYVSIKKTILKTFRILSILSILILAARPQLVDVTASNNINNIDIFISLDASGSMQLFDDMSNPKPRITAAKQEAINFLKKRSSDKIGFGIFATESLTLAPITDDKKFLEQVISGISIGVIPENTTAIGKGLAMGILRLKNSVSKSKIIIFLTDGAATEQNDFPIERAITLANDNNIKIYTVGIGSKQAYFRDQFGRTMPIIDSSFDEQLLKKISQSTGGRYFSVKNQEEMAIVYDEIDKLEKTTQEINSFTKYEEIFWPFFFISFIFLFLELFVSLYFWKILS
jgi:Ca-activated chloride channel family protein